MAATSESQAAISPARTSWSDAFATGVEQEDPPSRLRLRRSLAEEAEVERGAMKVQLLRIAQQEEIVPALRVVHAMGGEAHH